MQKNCKKIIDRLFYCISICVVSVLSQSCGIDSQPQILDAAGDDAKTVIVADLKAVLKSLDVFSGDSEMDLSHSPELASLTHIRGIDFHEVMALSYDGDSNALVAAIKYPIWLNMSLNKISRDKLKLGISTARSLAEGSSWYVVTDTAWLWVVSDIEGPAAAIRKVETMRNRSLAPQAPWKKELLTSDADVRAIFTAGKRYITSKVDFKESGAEARVGSRDKDGRVLAWLPNDKWKPLDDRYGVIYRGNDVSGAIGRIDLAYACRELGVRNPMPDFFGPNSMAGPANFAINLNPSAPADIFGAKFRINARLDSPAQATELEERAGRYLRFLPAIKMEAEADEITVSSDEFSELEAELCAGTLAAMSVHLDSKKTSEFAAAEVPGCDILVNVGADEAQIKMKFTETEKPFLSIIKQILE